VLVAVVGPLLWLGALVTVGLVVKRSGAVEIGLLAVLVSFLLTLIVCVVARRLRLQEELEAER
jgi:hypothetical protein